MSSPEALASPPLETPWVPLWPLATAGQVATKRIPVDPLGCSQAGFYTNPGFGDNADTTVYLSFPVPNDYQGGDITLWATLRGAATGVVVWKLFSLRFRPGAAILQLQNNVDDSHSPGTTNSLRRPIVFPAGQFQVGDTLRGDFRRDGANASDTMAGTYAFDGAYIEYQGLHSLAGGGVPVGYGTTLPASPVDGQEHILVDSLTAPTYWWRLRYNAASSSPYKWEYVGGSVWNRSHYAPVAVSGATQVGSTGYYRHTAMDFAVPRAGIYELDSIYRMDPNGAAGTINTNGYVGSVLQSALHGGVSPFITIAAGLETPVFTQAIVDVAAAGALIGVAVNTTLMGTHKINAEQIRIWPRRLA